MILEPIAVESYMDESGLWKKFKDNIQADFMKRIDATAVPDIFLKINDNISWIELKAKAAWPKRAKTGTNFGLEQDQAIWSYLYSRSDGKSYVFVWIEGIYLLFKGSDALKIADKVTKLEALELAILKIEDKTIWTHLQKELDHGG